MRRDSARHRCCIREPDLHLSFLPSPSLTFCYSYFKVSESSTQLFCCLVLKSCPTLATPWTVAHQASLSLGFSRQEYWSGLPFPFPGESSRPRDQTQGSNPGLLHWQAGSLPSEPPGKLSMQMLGMNKICMSHVTSVELCYESSHCTGP